MWKTKTGTRAMNRKLTNITTIILTINDLYTPIKEISKVDQKARLNVCCVQETHFKCQDIYRSKVKV